MRILLTLGAAAAALFAVAVTAPADATTRMTDGVQNGQSVQIDLSARRRHWRRHRHRYYVRRYYRPYYYAYPYAYYGPGYYPYYYRPHYYRRPGIYFGFGF